MVTQWQSLFYEDRFAHTHQRNPDFILLAQAMGVKAERCIAPNDVEGKLKWLLDSEGPALLEVVTDKKVPVLPMVPGGKALHEFLVYDEGLSTCNNFRNRNRKANSYHSQREGTQSAYEEAVRPLSSLKSLVLLRLRCFLRG